MNRRSTSLISTVLVAMGLIFQSCAEDNPTVPVTFQVVLNGTNEKPKTTNSTATGTFVGILKEDTRVMSYTVTYAGITPTMGHMHRIDTTKTDGTGPVEITFPNQASPIVSSTPELTPLQMYRLKNNQYYVNLHSTQFPDGEIRGDLKTKL